MKTKVSLVVVSIAYLATLALFGGSEAQAAVRRLHAGGICHEAYPTDSSFVQHQNVLHSSRGVNDTVWINCAVPSDSTLAHNGVVTLNIHGFEPAGASIYSQACSKAFNSASISCGAIANWGASYAGATISDKSAWVDGAAFPYILTNLRNGDLFGYYMAN